MEKIKVFKKDELSIKILNSKKQMGKVSAKETAGIIRKLQAEKDQINIVFASAPSQDEFLESLIEEKDIEWHKINAFHMDEYIGLEENHPQKFANYLKNKIYDKLSLNKIFYFNSDVEDPAEECARYTKLLHKHPVDIVCMGIGENAHIAFNEPHEADFDDSEMVKVIELDNTSRLQQVHDGCFERIEDVPRAAMTLTIPALVKADYIFCNVPGSNKSKAVYNTVNKDVDEKYPASVLRKHSGAILYLDQESGQDLDL